MVSESRDFATPQASDHLLSPSTATVQPMETLHHPNSSWNRIRASTNSLFNVFRSPSPPTLGVSDATIRPGTGFSASLTTSELNPLAAEFVPQMLPALREEQEIEVRNEFEANRQVYNQDRDALYARTRALHNGGPGAPGRSSFPPVLSPLD